MNDYINDIANNMRRQLDDWLRAVILKELGPEYYGCSDTQIAHEANTRGYKLTTELHNPLEHTITDTDGNMISTFRVSYKLES